MNKYSIKQRLEIIREVIITAKDEAEARKIFEDLNFNVINTNPARVKHKEDFIIDIGSPETEGPL